MLILSSIDFMAALIIAKFLCFRNHFSGSNIKMKIPLGTRAQTTQKSKFNGDDFEFV